MKRALTLLVSLFPAALIAQQVSVSVSLTASPAGSANVGTPITLTANAVAGKPGPELGIVRPMQENWRYTFTASRTWPCAESITIGARCFVNYGLVALDVAPITIGDDVQIGPNVQLLTPTHPVEPGPRRDKWRCDDRR